MMDLAHYALNITNTRVSQAVSLSSKALGPQVAFLRLCPYHSQSVPLIYHFACVTSLLMLPISKYLRAVSGKLIRPACSKTNPYTLHLKFCF